MDASPTAVALTPAAATATLLPAQPTVTAPSSSAPTATLDPADPPPPLISLAWEDLRIELSVVNPQLPSQTKYALFPDYDEAQLPCRQTMSAMGSGQKGGGGQKTAGGGVLANKSYKVQPSPVKQQQQQLQQHPPPPPSSSAPPAKKKSKANGSVVQNGPKKQSCHICGRGFNKSSYLKRHILSHSSVKPYKCEVCGWGFFQLGNLKRHMASHTISGQGFKCTHCQASFSTKSVLSVHMRDAHGEKIANSSSSSSAAAASKTTVAGGSVATVTPLSKVNSGSAAPMSLEDAMALSKKLPSDIVVSRQNGFGGETGSRTGSRTGTGSSLDSLPSSGVEGGRGSFSCTICLAPFDRVSALNKHIKTHGAAMAAQQGGNNTQTQ